MTPVSNMCNRWHQAANIMCTNITEILMTYIFGKKWFSSAMTSLIFLNQAIIVLEFIILMEYLQ